MKLIFIKDLKKEVLTTLFCWVANKRIGKENIFLDVYDSTGKIQCFADKNVSDYAGLKKINRESCVALVGELCDFNSKIEFKISDWKMISPSTLKISPYPNEPKFDVFDKKHGNTVITHPTFYIRNKKLADIFYVKAIFKRQLQNYFWNKGFVEFEPPTLTRQTLYDDSGAIWLERDGQKLSLSRCATFHLEPAIIPYEKIFTITNSHADEKVRTNRHLIEYLHMKAEMAWVNLDELVDFAKDMYYEVALKTYEISKSQFDAIVDPKITKQKLEKLKPENHKLITYDEAVKILHENGVEFEFGKSLTTKQEQILTRHFNESFVWVKYIPYNVEGFMFKRKLDDPKFTMTCDLIAPCGFGEILGCAEKMTDYDEIISSMEQKGKMKDFERYKDFAELHKFGLPPHGGIGMGIERAVRYLLNIDHVKFLKPFAIIKNSQVNH